jgi:hypothetical protein
MKCKDKHSKLDYHTWKRTIEVYSGIHKQMGEDTSFDESSTSVDRWRTTVSLRYLSLRLQRPHCAHMSRPKAGVVGQPTFEI